LDRGWVGPRAGLNAMEKRKIPSPRRESKSQTPIFQSVASVKMDFKEIGCDNVNWIEVV
jgi:hypothetical protein